MGAAFRASERAVCQGSATVRSQRLMRDFERVQHGVNYAGRAVVALFGAEVHERQVRAQVSNRRWSWDQ